MIRRNNNAAAATSAPLPVPQSAPEPRIQYVPCDMSEFFKEEFRKQGYTVVDIPLTCTPKAVETVLPPVVEVPAPIPGFGHPAIAYINGLFKADDLIFYQLIHSTLKHVMKDKSGNALIDKKTGEPRMSSDTKLLSLVRVRDAATAEYMETLTKLENDGWNVYVCMNPFPEGTKTRTEDLITVIRNLYLDVDNTKENGERALQLIEAAVKEGLIPPPTSILESSPGNYHIAWAVEGFTWDTAKAMLPVMAFKLGGDPGAVDLNRVLRLPGFHNLKKERGNFECRLVSHLLGEVDAYTPCEFKFATVVEKREKLVASSDAVEETYGYLVANAQEANFELENERDYGDGGIIFDVECPWADAHTNGGEMAAIMILGDGRPEFNCFHGHCNGTEGPKRGWSDIRDLWKERVGHFQRFGHERTEDVIQFHISESSNGSAKSAGSTAAEKTPTKMQEDYKAAADKADAVEETVEETPYPLHIWKGTPYYDFAMLATKDNFVPPGYLVNGLMTVTGAVAGHRIFPEFSPKMPAHFFSVFLSTIGGIGKNESLQWSADCYEGTGLLYQSGSNQHKNIGALRSDFGSARGAIDEFMLNPSILQEYGELTTPLEKFGIAGSGTSFLDLMNNTYDSINPNWSKIKGSKLPSVLPPWINNSMLSATTVKRWHERMGESNLETFIQRLNIVHTAETRTVFQLTTPNISTIRQRLMDRVGLLEEYKLIWHYGPEALEIGKKWHQDLMTRMGATTNDQEVDLSEVFGRIQVFAHRIVGHLALWLGPLPTTPIGPAKPAYIEGMDVPYVRKSESADKEWHVEVTGDMMSRAIEAAEYLVKVRELMMPSEGHDVRAKIENLIRKWAVRLGYCRWPELKRRATLRKYSSRDAVQCLANVEHTGILTVKRDPDNPADERQWVIVWIGDGRKTPKWKENRGGYRDGSGGYHRNTAEDKSERE